MSVAENVVGLTLGLALALLLASQNGVAGIVVDTDGDGLADSADNCVLHKNANGITEPGSSCGNQEDGDMDGYGNPCDSDLNNNGAPDLVDVSTLLAAASAVSTNLNTDLNCNGAADLTDVSRTLAEAAGLVLPGPSGLACAGTIPCP